MPNTLRRLAGPPSPATGRNGSATSDHNLSYLATAGSPNTWVYTKGTIRRKEGQEVFYVLVSAKLAL